MTTPTLTFMSRIFAFLLLIACASCESMQDKGSAERPVAVPEDAFALIDVKYIFSDGRCEGMIYNGSEWVILDLDIAVTKKATKEERKFRLQTAERRDNEKWKAGAPLYLYKAVPLKPLSTGYFEGNTGDFTDDFSKENFYWTAVNARGYKQ